MEADRKTISINPDDLVAKLHDVETAAQGDLARMIELLLLENHVLARDQSMGLRRGVDPDLSDFPRFLQIVDTEGPETDEG